MRINFTVSRPTPPVLAVLMATAFFAGILVVRAMDKPFSQTTAGSSLTFSGTVIGKTGTAMLTFHFYKGDADAEVCKADAPVNIDKDGSFIALVPVDRCNRSQLFDGGDLKYTVDVDRVALDMPKTPVASVPYAQFAERVGSPDCPAGYVRSAQEMAFVLCQRLDANGTAYDEIVKVGAGLSAFWIDRYEASVWDSPDGTGKQYGATDGTGNLVMPDYPGTFPKNGQATRQNFKYSLSKAGVQPSASLTWFQAQQACRASGKRLPTGEEWLAAATGTNDPGESDGVGGACVTKARGPRPAGTGVACTSEWGAQDMIGNFFEWTAEWYAGAGSEVFVSWPETSYGDGDAVAGVTNGPNGHSSSDRSGGYRAGLPAVAVRGGDWMIGIQSGVFQLKLDYAPSYWNLNVGLRCVVP